MSKGKIICMLSGGVDSSVAAYLLKKEGYDVIGIFMKNWHDDSVIEDSECPWIQDSNDALMVADKLDIPYYVVDFSEEYKRDIVDYMFSEYEYGRTPNPDVLCNTYIKFGRFLEQAHSLGVDMVTSGHYAIKEELEDGTFVLKKGVDPKKDQSYFLSHLSQNQLRYAKFPIGNYTKDEIRKIAEEQDLITANKKDSQGLCFVGNIKLVDFLSQKLKPKAGITMDIDTNEIVGQHKGAYFYTRGQRKGLGINGSSKPYYVASKDVDNNILYVTNDKSSKSINSNRIYVENTYVNPYIESIDDSDNIEMQIQYHGKFYSTKRNNIKIYGHFNNYDLKCSLDINLDNLDEPFYAPESGQFIVGYHKDIIIFSGEIKSYYNE